MTYKGKTVTRHQRGNWYVRLRHNGKVITVYSRTQIDCYDKLKIIADKIEIEKAQATLEKLTAQAYEKPIAKAEKAYTLKQWFDEWLNSYKVGNVRQATIDDFKKTMELRLWKLHNTDIKQITSLMLSKTINEICGCRSKDKAHNLCRQMFTIAFNNRIVDTNPTLILPKPKQFAKFYKKAFTPEQESKFINYAWITWKSLSRF